MIWKTRNNWLKNKWENKGKLRYPLKPNIIVEIDESMFGKQKYNRGHRVDGVWVLDLVERSEAWKIFFISVPDRKKETLHG